MKIAIVNQKGGVGKSTLAFNMSLILAVKGYDVAVVDADKQHSCSYFLKKRGDDLKNLHIYEESDNLDLDERIGELTNEYVIMDCPGWNAEFVFTAASRADVVVIPIVGAAFDIHSTNATVRALNVVKRHYADLKCNILITKAAKGRVLSKGLRDDLAKRYPEYHVLNSQMGDREVYKKSPFAYQSVCEFDNGKNPAAKEMAEIVEEIISL